MSAPSLAPSPAVITPTVGTSSVATLTAIVCVAVGLLIVPAFATAMPWIPPVDLSTPSEFSVWEPRPEIAISGGGGGVAIWPQSKGLGTLEAASMSLTGTWGPPVTLAPNEWGQREEPELAMNEAGEAVAVWKHFGPEQSTIVARVRTPSGEWGPQEALSPEGSPYGGIDVAVGPAGEAVAVWSQIPRFGSNSEYRIESSFKPAGGHWEPAVTLSDPEHESYSPQVAIAPTGRIVAAFYGFLDSPERHPTVQVAEKQGGQWSPPQALSGAPNAAFPKVEASAAGATVLWQSRDEEGEERWIEAASRASGEWAEPVELSGPESFQPQIGVDAAGTAVAIWTSSYGKEGDYVESSTHPVGGHWSEPTLISGPVAERSARLAVAPNGRTLAAWPAPDPFLEEPVVEGALGLEGEWEEPTTLSAAGAWAVRPAVALDGQGDGMVAWWAGNPTLPQATEFVAPRPTAPIVPAPAPTSTPPTPSRSVRGGTAFAAHLARVKRGRVLLRLRCRGGGRCRGAVKLLVGRKLIGKARFGIAAGKARVIRVKLNHKGRKLLRKTHRHRLKLKLRGRDVRHRVVVVKYLRRQR